MSNKVVCCWWSSFLSNKQFIRMLIRFLGQSTMCCPSHVHHNNVSVIIACAFFESIRSNPHAIILGPKLVLDVCELTSIVPPPSNAARS